MKKTILFLIFTSFIFTIKAQNNIIKANPLGFAFGIANIGVEFAGKGNQSTTISALYYSKDEIKGGGIGLEQRFYFATNQSLKGFHAGPSIGYFKLSETDHYDDSYNVFAVGVEIGHQWFLGNHFTADIFSGASFLVADTTQEEFSVGVGFSLGYAW